MKTLRLAAVIAVMTINLSAEMLYTSLDDPATPRSASGRDDVTVIVEEVSWPQVCGYSVSESRPDDMSLVYLVYRKDTYVASECIGPRSRSPTPYTLSIGPLNFGPGRH